MHISSHTQNVLFIPESKGHGIEASFYFAEERTGSFHLQAVLLTGVPLINRGPQTSISGLVINDRGLKQSVSVLYTKVFISYTFGSYK